MSIDGKIALATRKQIRISNEGDMKRVHALRHACDAVLVGVGTVLEDNPKLTVKEKYVQNPVQPLRIVIDSYFRTPETAEVMSSVAPTLIVTACTEFKKDNIEVIACGEEHVDLKKLMHLLYERGIKKLLVEGGETVIWEFLKHRLVDELSVFLSPIIIGGVHTPSLAGGEGASLPEDVINMRLGGVVKLGDGVVLTFYPSTS
jgi:2,5-diamino-6-(ribosylamino)-4(3H)-pyrimidinone 5'-phosphate reductase